MESRIKESPESLFEVYVEVVGPTTPSTGPEIRRKFPEDFQDEETIKTVPKFCFPLSLDSVPVNQTDQNFTFVLTDANSKHKFGFCRLSSSSRTCFCILSYLPWFDVYYKLLNIIADYTVIGQESNFQELLASLHRLSIPEPGVPVQVATHFYFTVPDLKELPRIPENRNLTEYFVAVDVNNMLQVYASMLHERRILICCSTLSTLTACVHGSAAMLYPMYWQHVYIPVLPPHLLDYCCAPMPYLIGVHSSLMGKIQGMAMDDVVILNVDNNTLETPHHDLQTLPHDVVSSLKNRLKKFSSTPGDGVARAFLKSQAALFGSYRNALQIELGEPITFNEDTFVNHRLSAMREFLQNAIQLQLFKQFIDGRLELLNSGEGFSDIFEEEISKGEYAGSDKSYHQWLITVKKGSGAILNTVKTKANPAMKTAYKFAKDHAKMGIKEVKSRLKQKENTDNGPGIIDEDKEYVAKRFEMEETSQSLDEHRINRLFGLSPMLMKKTNSSESLEGHHDQSQRYCSLREVDWTEDSDSNLDFRRRRPLQKNLASASKLAHFFSRLDEHDGQPLPLAKSLEDLKSLKDYEKLHTEFTRERLDLGFSEHPQIPLGLKLPNTYNKLLDIECDQPESDFWDHNNPCKKTQSAHFLTQKNEHNSQITDPGGPDRSAPDDITIPRPHGRKSAELGTALAPSGSKASNGERTKAGDGEGRSSDVEDQVDLIRLLDPLNKPPKTISSSTREELTFLQQKSRLPPQAFFQPHGLTSHSVWTPSVYNSLPRMQYLSGARCAPFHEAPSGSPLQNPSYSQPYPSLSEISNQHWTHGPALFPSFQTGNPYNPNIPQTLSGLSDSILVPNAAPKSGPGQVQEEQEKVEDPFRDLLTMMKPTITLEKTTDRPQKGWETFD
ncbi:DENN domain-containing protein 1A isoform X2 [Stigmatopora argus]